MDEAAEAGAKIIVFPELCITGYTCSDLFLQDILLNSAKKALVEIAEHTKNLDALVFVGVPIAVGGTNGISFPPNRIFSAFFGPGRNWRIS